MSDPIDIQFTELKESYENIEDNLDSKTIENFKSSLEDFKIVFFASNINMRKKYEKDLDYYQDKSNELTRKQLLGTNIRTGKVDTIGVLKTANHQLEESIAVGTNTLQKLKEQEETIRGIQKKLTETNAQLSTSNKILNRLKSFFRWK